MDWNKAKNLTIVFLLIVNGFLIALVYINSAKYTLSQEQEQAIVTVLSQNHIRLQAPIPKHYKPMAPITFGQADYDMPQLFSALFGDDAKLALSEEFDKTIFTDDQNRVLTVSGDLLVFEDPAGSGAFEFSKANAKAACDEIMASNKALFPRFELEDPNGFETKDGYRLVYYERYKNYLIYTNYVAFTLTEKGVIKREYSYKKPAGFEKKKQEITSPDEALFTFMQYMKNMYKNQETVVNRIDIVYDRDEGMAENTSTPKAIPCYRFWVEGTDRPYLINAYTGNIK